MGRVLSVISAMFSFGMALGPVTGGWIAENYGMNSSYLVAFVVFVFSNLSLIFIQSQPIDAHDPSAPPQSLLKNSYFLSFLMIYAFVVFALYVAQPLTPNFLKGVRELTLTETGWIFSAGALGNSVMMLLLSRLQPRRGFIVAQFMVILFAALIWQGSGLPIFMLGYFLLGGFRAARPMAMAQARELVHSSQMGLSYGAMETVSATIFIIAPPIAGFIFDRDPYSIYPIAIGLIAASMLVSYIFAPRKIETLPIYLQS